MTALTRDGLIVVSSIPRPQCDWLDMFLAGQELYVQWDREEGYVIDMDAFEFMLQSAAVPKLNPLPN